MCDVKYCSSAITSHCLLVSPCSLFLSVCLCLSLFVRLLSLSLSVSLSPHGGIFALSETMTVCIHLLFMVCFELTLKSGQDLIIDTCGFRRLSDHGRCKSTGLDRGDYHLRKLHRYVLCVCVFCVLILRYVLHCLACEFTAGY